jgi:short-subunit dehydrogenase
VAFTDKYGPWAFIAGASVGIGAAFSHEAAARGLNVAMMARGEDQLRATAAEVAERHGVETRAIPGDLTSPDIGDIVAAGTDDLEIGLFVYNATIALQGEFLDVPVSEHLASVAVNCSTPIILTSLLGNKMRARGRGGIGLVSSMGGLQGSKFFSTYNAGKAFEWILAETLWAELKDQGVDATTIMVGATSSPNYLLFQETLDPELCTKTDTDDPLDRARSRLMNPATPEEVATALYDQLGDGPVCFSTADDAFVAEKVFQLSRKEAVEVWVGVQETPTRMATHTAR